MENTNTAKIPFPSCDLCYKVFNLDIGSPNTNLDFRFHLELPVFLLPDTLPPFLFSLEEKCFYSSYPVSLLSSGKVKLGKGKWEFFSNSCFSYHGIFIRGQVILWGGMVHLSADTCNFVKKPCSKEKFYFFLEMFSYKG